MSKAHDTGPSCIEAKHIGWLHVPMGKVRSGGIEQRDCVVLPLLILGVYTLLSMSHW